MKITLIVEIEAEGNEVLGVSSDVRDRVRDALDDAFDSDSRFYQDTLVSVKVF